MNVSAIKTEFPYAPSSAEGFRDRQVSRVSWFWLKTGVAIASGCSRHSPTHPSPVTLITSKMAAFAATTPSLKVRPRVKPSRARVERATSVSGRDCRATRAKKKPYPPCAVVDLRAATRACRAHDDDATHVTDPVPSVRFPCVSRLSSAARPPVSSAARLSRYARCDAHRGD